MIKAKKGNVLVKNDITTVMLCSSQSPKDSRILNMKVSIAKTLSAKFKIVKMTKSSLNFIYLHFPKPNRFRIVKITQDFKKFKNILRKYTSRGDSIFIPQINMISRSICKGLTVSFPVVFKKNQCLCATSYFGA